MTSTNTGKPLGRPRRADPQRVDYHQLDTLLVMGELQNDAERGPITVYPSYRDLAKRFGVSNSLIAAYSTKHECLRRREAAAHKIRKLTDDKVIARRGTALAEAKEQMLAVIDKFIDAFGKALEEGRVRVDSVADLNIMVRLREYLNGGADSRTEVRGMPTLEDLEKRYEAAQRRQQEEGPLAGGVVVPDRESARRARILAAEHPPSAFEEDDAEVSGHLAVHEGDEDEDDADLPVEGDEP